VNVALQRYEKEIKQNKQMRIAVDKVLSSCQRSLEDDRVYLVFKKNKASKIWEASKDINWGAGEVFLVLQGDNEITVLLDKRNINKIRTDYIEKRTALGVVSIREQEYSSKDCYGYIMTLTNHLTERQIPIEDIASTYKQVFIVVKEIHLSQTFDILSEVITSSN
jgi:hypothetical protein